MAAGRGLGEFLRGFLQRSGGRPFSHSQSRAAPRSAQEAVEKMRAQKREQQKSKERQETTQDTVSRRVQELAQLSGRLQQVHLNVLAKALKNGILYQDKKIVVINKPYGIPVHGGPKVKRCLIDVLPILAKMLDGMKAEPLHLCHRLDKETTGVMVLARDQDTAHQIQELFKTRKVEKKYWAICIGIPEPAEGLVDIPMVEKEVESHQPHYKMTLAPNYRVSLEHGNIFKVRRHRDAYLAATHYQTLSSSSSCSLLELRPVTGVKHQLRVHLAYGLGCPILGDHKYSHWNKLAPQKLPMGTLKRLGLRQTKARHLPMYLHACQLSIPKKDASEEDKIHVVCRPPAFFTRTLKRLKLEHPELGKVSK